MPNNDKFLTLEGLTYYDSKIKEVITGSIPELSTVATSGSYEDLTDKPVIPVVPSVAVSIADGETGYTTGDQVYDYVTNAIPTLATVATSGDYADLSNTPSLANVATSGNYSDLNGKPSYAVVATSGSYEDLEDKPYGQEITTKYTLGNFSYTMNPEHIDPATGNWVNPEDPNDTEPVEKAWGYDAENDHYTSDYIKSDSLVKGYPDTWTDFGTEYNAIIWGDPAGQQYALNNPDLSEFITEPADLLNYSVRLTCNGTEYLLPILQHTGTEQDSGYYAGQLSTGEVANLVDPTGTYDSDHLTTYAHTLYTHPFQIHFGIDNNEVYQLLVSLRIAGDVVLENVEIVEVGQLKMIDPKYIPVITNTEINALFSNS